MKLGGQLVLRIGPLGQVGMRYKQLWFVWMVGVVGVPDSKLSCPFIIHHFYYNSILDSEIMGSFRVLISSIMYFIGTFLLNPACLLLLPFGSVTAGVMILICACSFLTAAAGLDAICVIYIQRDIRSMLQKFNALCMLVGGILFLIGSILYLPSIGTLFGYSPTNVGTWVFRTGSFFYLGGSFTSLHLLEQPNNEDREDIKYGSLTSQDEDYCPSGGAPLLTPTRHNIGDSISEPQRSQLSTKTMWLLVIYNYIFGALAYITGGVLSQMFGAVLAGGITWCVGSLLFVIGAFLQLYEVVRSWNEWRKEKVVLLLCICLQCVHLELHVFQLLYSCLKPRCVTDCVLRNLEGSPRSNFISV